MQPSGNGAVDQNRKSRLNLMMKARFSSSGNWKGSVPNLFRVGRHLLRAVHHRRLRTQAFGVWREVTCV
ncbi:MAG TPA: hypothetical protein DEQ98_01780 [Acidobacteria bacterium]|nr:hypothetical protein [Acidobacteriota bacterium]HCE01945.1 hypothetical protein [Acidobacteriota bacterium]